MKKLFGILTLVLAAIMVALVDHTIASLIFGSSSAVSFATLTALSGTAKSTSQKTARQRSFSAKEDAADSAVACPPDALKSIEVKITGENDDGPFGTNTIGQKIEGKIMIYAANADLRTFCHELVTKDIEFAAFTTNSGMSYVFSTADGTPAVVFSYDNADLVTNDDKPVMITLNITGYRDNLVIN